MIAEEINFEIVSKADKKGEVHRSLKKISRINIYFLGEVKRNSLHLPRNYSSLLKI